MVILLGLTAAVLYGSGDFLGGMATRKAHVLTVLTLVETAGVIVALAAAVMSSGPASLAGLAWGFSAGLVVGSVRSTTSRSRALSPVGTAAAVWSARGRKAATCTTTAPATARKLMCARRCWRLNSTM